MYNFGNVPKIFPQKLQQTDNPAEDQSSQFPDATPLFQSPLPNTPTPFPYPTIWGLRNFSRLL